MQRTEATPARTARKPRGKTVAARQPQGHYVMTRQEQSEYMARHFANLAASLNKKTATKMLQRAGILDSEGELAEPYCEAA